MTSRSINCFISLGLGLLFLGCFQISRADAVEITRKMISKDKSIATVTYQLGESVDLPARGGGEPIHLVCSGLDVCQMTLRDFKEKSGEFTYSIFNTDNVSALQTAPLQTIQGSIDSGFGTVELTTSGFPGLFNNVTVPIKLITSTSFIAIVGTPGDQLPQGGNVFYRTEWFSDQAIGIDPITGSEIIFDDFFLNSALPLIEFVYSITDGDMIRGSFTIGENYIFSTGLEIEGVVTKDFSTVPEPNTAAILLSAFAFAGAVFLSVRPATN